VVTIVAHREGTTKKGYLFAPRRGRYKRKIRLKWGGKPLSFGKGT